VRRRREGPWTAPVSACKPWLLLSGPHRTFSARLVRGPPPDPTKAFPYNFVLLYYFILLKNFYNFVLYDCSRCKDGDGGRTGGRAFGRGPLLP
jgi:hypothetical protein